MLPWLKDRSGKQVNEVFLPKITKRFVDTLRPDSNGRDVFIWDAGDSALKGFGVRMKPSGASSYFVQYRNREGRTRRLVLGRVGELTPDEARRRAADRLKEARGGADPSADRHAARKAVTVSEICNLYLADAKGRIKPSTLVMDQSRIDCHVIPLLGRRAVTGLTRRDIELCSPDADATRCSRFRGRGSMRKRAAFGSRILRAARRFAQLALRPRNTWSRSRAKRVAGGFFRPSGVTAI
jgi:hypothetical protein